MSLALSAMRVVLFTCSIIIGFFLFLRPSSAIDLQKRFYEKINWRIEPVSLAKEIRNTKIMGLFIILASFFSAICLLAKCKIPPQG